jgi:hypothetical protein
MKEHATIAMMLTIRKRCVRPEGTAEGNWSAVVF